MPTIKELRRICQNSIDDELNRTLRVKIHRFFSIYITRILIKTPITPNQITLFSIFIILFTAGLFATGNYFLSLLTIIPMELVIILDCVDGEVARYKKSFSLNGVFIEKLPEVISLPLIYGGVTIGVFQNEHGIIFLIFGISAIIFNFFNSIIQNLKHSTILCRLMDLSKEKSLYKDVINIQPKKSDKIKLSKKILKEIFQWIQCSKSIYIIYVAAIFNFLSYIILVYGTLLPILTIVIIIKELKTGTEHWEYLFKQFQNKN